MKIPFKNDYLIEKRQLRLTKTGIDTKERVRLDKTAMNTVNVLELKKKATNNEADEWALIDTLPMNLFYDSNGRSLFKNRDSFYAIHESDQLEVVRYVNLHGHSEYSILDCISRVKDIVAKAEWAIAVTDHGNMFGSLEFYKEMKKAGKKPLIGFEAYHYSRDKEVKSHHLVLLAKNAVGVKNLFKLTSGGYHNFSNKPQITWDDMKEYSEGVVCLSACIAGEIPQAIIRGEMDEARSLIQGMIDIYGKENYYLEIQRHGIAEEKIVEKAILELAVEFDLKVVATTDSHFTNKEDREIHDIHLCIGTKRLLSDPTRWSFTGDGYHIHTSEEMVERFSDLPDVLDNTLDLAEKMNPTLETGKVFMPHFPLPKPFTEENDYLRNLVMKGFEQRFKGKPAFTSEEYKERIDFELKTVQRMGFPGYFLIVWDFVRFARSKGILVGPGRGSACGSLLTYCLGITNVDPIPFGLLFERFLNPDRISMPDIDIDFPDTRREEVLEYVRDLYGADAVSGVITFGRMKSKSVSRDVCRVMGFPPSVGASITKLVPKKLEDGGENVKVTLKNLLRLSLEFKQLYKSSPDVQKIVDFAIQLEGLPKTLSQHACATLISPSAVSDYIPLVTLANKATGGRDTVTQFAMDECEEMGILKMDFLGLRTMGVFDRTLQYINQSREKGKPLELDDIPIGDHSVYDFIAKGNTAGVFQLESSGMTGLMGQLFQDLQNMKRTEEEGVQLFERLVAGISLYRPGPMDEIPNYVKNMLTPKGIHYDLPKIKDIMSPTYNVIVYQEQVMFIVRILAGFSKGDADAVRKAMGKKDEELLDKYGKYFLDGDAEKGIIGAVANGIEKKVAEELWERMKKFGLYAFNKSHAVGYADISIRSAWMSHYYSTEFMTATLNSFLSKADRIKQFMTVCKNRGILILPPAVNHSVQDFKVDGEAIRFGFGGIRNMGSYGELIIEEREASGQFTSLSNFIERMATGHGINRKRIESLIYAGALDSFDGTRQEKLGMIDLLVGLASVAKGDKSNGTYSLLSMPMFNPITTHLFGSKGIKEMSEKMRLEKEREFTGFYVSGHPMNEYEAVFNNPKIKNFYPINQTLPTFVEEDLDDDTVIVDDAFEGEMIRIAGVVQEVEVRTTRNNQQMANIIIEDTTATIKAIIFPITFSQHIQRIRNGEVLAFYGKVETSEFGTQFIVNGIETMDELMTPDDVESMTLYLNPSQAEAQLEFKQILDVFNERPSECNVPVSIVMDGKTYTKRGGNLILGNTKLLTIVKLQTLLGRQSVSVHYGK